MVGEMGVGKSTVGEALAASLDRIFLDSDQEIERVHGRSSAEIADVDGVEALHSLELGTLGHMAASDSPAVLAPAASVVDEPSGRQALAGTFVIWLTAPDHALAKRRAAGGHRRPLSERERQELRERRYPALRELANMTIDTGRISPDEVVDAALRGLGSDQPSK